MRLALVLLALAACVPPAQPTSPRGPGRSSGQTLTERRVERLERRIRAVEENIQTVLDLQTKLSRAAAADHETLTQNTKLLDRKIRLLVEKYQHTHRALGKVIEFIEAQGRAQGLAP